MFAAKSLVRNACRRSPASVGAVRFLNVHEYISMEIMKNHGIQTPECHVASTPEEAENLYQSAFNKRT
jgi:succinyl-CoA synthetase beta subunit